MQLNGVDITCSAEAFQVVAQAMVDHGNPWSHTEAVLGYLGLPHGAVLHGTRTVASIIHSMWRTNAIERKPLDGTESRRGKGRFAYRLTPTGVCLAPRQPADGVPMMSGPAVVGCPPIGSIEDAFAAVARALEALHGPVTPAEICRCLGIQDTDVLIKSYAVSSLLTRMVMAGDVRRAAQSPSGTRFVYTLTDQGRALLPPIPAPEEASMIPTPDAHAMQPEPQPAACPSPVPLFPVATSAMTNDLGHSPDPAASWGGQLLSQGAVLDRMFQIGKDFAQQVSERDETITARDVTIASLTAELKGRNALIEQHQQEQVAAHKEIARLKDDLELAQMEIEEFKRQPSAPAVPLCTPEQMAELASFGLPVGI